MKFFGGFQLEEIAEAMDISVATVKRDWDFAKVWLYDQLNGNSA
jgi:DNA-directed RNA polymerase specialized sigma24 family protein